MSEIQNPYDIRHYAMRAWTKSVVTKVTPLHQSDCDFDFSDGFFSFSSFHLVHVPDYVAPRETSIALLLSRYCAGGADFKLGFKNSYPDQNDAQGRYDAIRSIPVCSRLH